MTVFVTRRPLMDIFGKFMRRMTRITTAILVADVSDARLRVLSLYFEGRNERVFSGHIDAVHLAL